MANAEHVARLKRSTAKWNEWREAEPDTVPELSKAQLFLLNLRDANLAGADLTEAVLCGADLSGANLEGAKLCGADLTDANLADTCLSEADLTPIQTGVSP